MGGAVVAWLLLGLGLYFGYAGRVLPRTEVAGIALGGLTPSAAMERLASADVSSRQVEFSYRDRRFTVEAAKVGFRLERRTTLERAMVAGRDEPLGAVTYFTALWSGRTLPAAYDVEEARLKEAVAKIARRVDRPPFHGKLNFATPGAKGVRVRLAPPRSGREVKREAASAALLAALRDPEETARVSLPVRTTKVPAGAAQKVVREARQLLAKPVRLGRGEKAVRIAPRELAPLLKLEVRHRDGAEEVRLGVRRQPMSKLVKKLAREVKREPVDARMSAPAAPVTVSSQGNMSWKPEKASVGVKPGRRGQALEKKVAAKTLTRLVREGKHHAKLPARKVRPEVPVPAAKQVNSLIGTFTTSFACCKPRVTNIKQIAKAVDGTVIMPGEEFSLNGVAGPRTRAKGYVPAPFILRGKLVPDVGGGTSQFSTTMYNAAYFAGLQLGFHQPHSYYISRYPAGREATLNYPTIDLNWVNNTDAPVLIRTATSDTSVTVSLFGDNGGRTVRAISGPREPWDGGAFKMTVTREITYPDGRVEQDSYTTHYDKPPSGH